MKVTTNNKTYTKTSWCLPSKK